LLDAGTPRPQAMLFTLWGDYVVHRGGEISVASLIRIAAEFGLSEVAVRALLARMARAGWLDAERRGRRSFYRLTARGRSVIREGTTRIFHPRPERDGWSGAWQIVAYSIPEAHRERRDQFRKRLVYLGFGLLASGAWISPYELTADVEDLAVELRVRCYVELFHGCNVARSEAPALAARVWRLEPLAAAYQTFERRWRGLGAELANGDVDDARAFARSTSGGAVRNAPRAPCTGRQSLLRHGVRDHQLRALVRPSGHSTTIAL
jgi:phenylacetic acid degradation operon negative regulatory protein